MHSHIDFNKLEHLNLDTSLTLRESTWILIAMSFLWIAAQLSVVYSLEAVSIILAPLAEWTNLIFVFSATISASLFTAALLKRAVKLQFVVEFAIAVLLAYLLPTT